MQGGVQLCTVGASGSFGPILVWNLPDLGGYSGGFSLGPMFSYVHGNVGIDISVEFALEEYKGERAIAVFLAPAFGEEVTVAVSGSHTWTLEDVLTWILTLVQ